MSVCNADSKLVLSYLCGGRDAEWANRFMKDLASRLTTRIQITTDGHRAYAEAVEGAFGADVDFAQLIKLYGDEAGPGPEHKYSPGVCTGASKMPIEGEPDPKYISTSHVERANLSMRMGMRRFTRLTNAFSKKLENHMHAVSFYFMIYNFVKIHSSIKTTPAMEAGVTTYLWSMEDIVMMTDTSK